jgi:thioesterase domain-containing protein
MSAWRSGNVLSPQENPANGRRSQIADAAARQHLTACCSQHPDGVKNAYGEPMSARNEFADLEQRLHADIPLARQMQVRVLAADADGLLLCAPLGPNANDKGTAFGGSLYSIAVLAGWALLSLQARSRGVDCQVVIQQSSVEYLEPVTADFQANARTPNAAEIERCLKTLARYGRARIEVEVTIASADRPVVRMRGRYVLASA